MSRKKKRSNSRRARAGGQDAPSTISSSAIDAVRASSVPATTQPGRVDGKAFPPYIEVRNTCAADSVEAFICEVARCEAPIKIDVLTSYVRERFPEHCQNRNDKYIHTEIY